MDQAIFNYLGSFLLYTGVMIGVIYLVYALVHKGVYSGAQPQGSLSKGSTLPAHLQGFLGIKPKVHDPQALCVESRLALEPRKNIYILRTGNERFAVATTLEGTQFLTRLESTPIDPNPVQTVTDLNDPQYQEDLLREEESSPLGKAPSFLGALHRQMGQFITAPQRLKQTQQQAQPSDISADAPPRPRC